MEKFKKHQHSRQSKNK